MVTRALISTLSIVVFLTLAITDSTMVGAANDEDLEVITASNAHRIERLRTIGIRDRVPNGFLVAVEWTDIVFSPNGAFIAAHNGWVDYLRILSVSTGNEVATFKINAGVQYAIFSPDSTKIAIVDTDYRLSVWNIVTGKLMWITNPITSTVKFNPLGTLLAGGSVNETVILWDVQTGKQVASLMGKQPDKVEFNPFVQQVHVHDVAFSPNGDQLAATNHLTNIRGPVDLPAGGVLIWDINSQQLLLDLRGDEDILAWWVTFTPSNELVIVSVSKTKEDKSAYPDGKIVSFWNAMEGKSFAKTEIRKSDVDEMLFSTSTRFVASSELPGYVWNTSTGHEVSTGEIEGKALDFSRDDTLIATTCKLINVATYESVSNNLEDSACTDDQFTHPANVAFSPDGTLLALLMANNRVQLWGVKQNNLGD